LKNIFYRICFFSAGIEGLILLFEIISYAVPALNNKYIPEHFPVTPCGTASNEPQGSGDFLKDNVTSRLSDHIQQVNIHQCLGLHRLV